jgi:hypothetical protein
MITPREVQMKRLDESQRSAVLDQEPLKVVGNGGHVLARTPTSAVVDVGPRSTTSCTC